MPGKQGMAPSQDKSEIPVIHKNAVYSLDQARGALGLAKATLGREIRLGRLRVAKRAGKCLILGRWLIEWIERGEVKRHRQAVATGLERPGTEDQER